MNRCTAIVIAALMASAPAAGRLPARATAADSARQDFRVRLLQALDLSEAQRDSLRGLRSGLQVELEILRAEAEAGRLFPLEVRSRYRGALAAYRSALDSVLDGRQQALLERSRRYLRQQRLGAGEGDGEESERLVAALGMSADQKRRWLSLLERLRAQVRTMREEGEVPSRDDLRRLREQHRLAFEAILTPEQRLELERFRVREARRRELEQAAWDLPEDLEGGTQDPDPSAGAEP